MGGHSLLQQTLSFTTDVEETIVFELLEQSDDPVVNRVGYVGSTLSTGKDYVELLPMELDYSSPESYGQSLDQYSDRLFDVAGGFIPGGFDRENAPSYRDLYVPNVATSAWGNLPELLRDTLNPPDPPTAGGSPGSPGYCFYSGSGSVSHVEIIYSYTAYSDSEESYPIYTQGGEYIGDIVVNRYTSDVSEKYLVRCFFPWSQKKHLFNPRLDLYPEGIEGFECPSACIRAGVTGGCFELRGRDEIPAGNGYVGFIKEYDLLLNVGGSCYRVFSFMNFQIALAERSGGGLHAVYGHRFASISYRLVYNPLGDYPFGKEYNKPARPEDFMAEKECCSCRRIAAMLAIQTSVQTAINGAIAVAQTKVLAKAILLSKGLNFAINIPSPQFSLFDSLIGLDGIIGAIKSAIDGVEPIALNEGDEEVNLSEIINRLEYLKQESDKLRKDAKRTFNILAGESWFNSENSLQPQLELNPEDIVRASRNTIFPDDDGDCKEIRANSILGLMGAFEAVNHHRSGAYRLPGKLPKKLFDDEDEDQMSILDLATLTQWLAVQMDGMMGQYPLKVKYKNADGQQQTLNIQNQSEILAEILGLLLGISTDVDVSVELGMKSTVEAIKAANAAILASDYAKANAEFLGYKGKEIGREIPLTITPKATNLKDALKESKMKGSGFKFDDKEDLQDLIRRLLVGVEIVKAAFFNPFNEDNDRIPGDRMRRDQRETNEREDKQWSEFIANTENPPARLRRDETAPQPDLKDVSTSKDAS
ncbi:hypothetical protein H6G89_32785 [Oscillatoria sp. FACHB-1407]|uniref:hypothetical protein n=1 Tax=Oscillatoria sp. FACHB-1407 TaxID=2692847 RepID=UPI001688269A|nr:hypothetical protein [Oscillatoria sp. FACHB-1407]MBD2465767.1 hypothetical protein [Oscillatoria sp. FACHB-1407]